MNMLALTTNASLMPFVAVISGETLINALIQLVIWGLILWCCWWGLGKIAPPEPFMKIGNVILVLLTVLVLINILLSIAGRPIVRF